MKKTTQAKQMHNYKDEPIADEISGATLVHYLILPEKTVYGVEKLAICTYDVPEDDEYYLFQCDESWNVIEETEHENAAEAIALAEEKFEIKDLLWEYPERGVS